MAREGAFDGTDAAMMIHPSSQNLVTMPCIAIAEVEAIFHGRAAHASRCPIRGLNALDAVVTAYQASRSFASTSATPTASHGIITEGGLRRTSCRSARRAASSCARWTAHELAPLKARVQKCFEAGALATGCTLRRIGATPIISTSRPIGRWRRCTRRTPCGSAREFFPVKDLPAGYAGSTDMGNVSHRVPSIHPMLGVAPSNVIIHNPSSPAMPPRRARRGGARRRQIARHDGARSHGRCGTARGGARRFRKRRRSYPRPRSPARASP